MCRLRVKIRVTGKKNQEFVRFILVPKDRRQRSNYLLSFGYWDTRQNNKVRFIVLNILKMMDFYYYGATFNKKTLFQFYNYLVDFHNLKTWVYFKQNQFMLFLKNEIKKKYL